MNLTKRKSVTMIYHIMVWIVLFSLPYMLSSGQNQGIKNVIVFSWIPLFLYAIIFYLNYFVFIDRFLFPKKTVLYVLINGALIIFFFVLNKELKDTFFRDPLLHNSKLDEHKPPKELFIYIDVITFIVPMIFSIALKTTERWVTMEVQRKEADTIKLQSELQHLKYQLQPHFFFNSLNNIYSLVDFSPEKAKQTVHSLGKLMRYLLYETNSEKVSLKKEISFMINYIELMKLRLTDNTKVTYEFPFLQEDIQIAPLLFISLIENAFKHGVSANMKTEIIFTMTVKGTAVSFSSQNHNFPKTASDKSGSGIGLDNLKKRLLLLCPEKHSFVTKTESDIFIVNLDITT